MLLAASQFSHQRASLMACWLGVRCKKQCLYACGNCAEKAMMPARWERPSGTASAQCTNNPVRISVSCNDTVLWLSQLVILVVNFVHFAVGMLTCLLARSHSKPRYVKMYAKWHVFSGLQGHPSLSATLQMACSEKSGGAPLGV